MITKLIFGLTSVMARDNKRELAATGDATESIDLVEFDMEHTSNEGYKFHYANYGTDWKEIEGLDAKDNKCSADIQSPINLMEPIGSYGWAYGYPKAKVDDKWTSEYNNVKDVLIEWDYNKIQVTFSQEDALQMFMESNLAETAIGGKSKRFQPTHMVLKSPSEHTINGHHYDVELQVYHDAETKDGNDIKHSATAIMFSVEEFDAIDEKNNKTFQDFFRQFKFEDHEDKVAPIFDIGDALNIIDYSERWVYKGSVSEPPCT